MIPKIIHYCWLSNDPYPAKIQKCIDSWKRILPEYEIWLWNFERFNIEQSVWVQEAFEAKKYAFAADYIRLYALHQYGGIYLDSDVEVLKSFNAFLDSDHMVGWEVKDFGIEAAIIGAERNAEWVEKCLEYYSWRHFIKENGTFDMKPLPQIIYSQLCKHNYITNETRLQKDNGEWKIYPNDFFSPKSYKDMKIYMTENTVTIHHFAGSWLPWDARLKQHYPWFSKNYPRLFYYCLYLPNYELRKWGIVK